MGTRRMWEETEVDIITNLGGKINELGSNVDRLKGNFGSFHF